MILQLARRLIPILLCVGALIACARPDSPPEAVSKSIPAIELKNCHLSASGFSSRIEAQCGTFSVPEDRTSSAGRQITLNLAVLPALSRNPQPDPLFFLTGGPGQAATESYPQLAGAFETINRKRDIVLVDQRGTGQSNPLRCPTPENIDLAATFTDEAQAQYTQECVAALDTDLRFYTTTIAMQDLDEVRAALGYDTINLYGVSYGTRAALTYLQQYPDRVRALILDGVAPQDWDIGFYFARDAQRALDLIFERCATDPDCNAAFPNVRGEFDAMLTALGEEPVNVALSHPVTGQPTEVTLTRKLAASTIRLLSYTPETAALIPLLIHTAQAEGDYRPLAAQFLSGGENLSATMSDGMTYSVLCAEDVRFTHEMAARANEDFYVGDMVTDMLLGVCSEWPKGYIPPGFKSPVVSSVPALLLSGEADPVTPPANADHVAESLSNSLHIVVKGQGHNVVFRGCLPRLAAEFVEQGSVVGLDTACVETIQPMPFFIDFTGPMP